MSSRFLTAVHQLTKPSALRSFSTSIAVASGHSRWSKIKHDKGKADAVKGNVRTEISKQITRASKYGGPDPAFNAALPRLIADAKRSGMSKTAIETAIARGQGVSASGQALESFNYEFLFPESNIAGIFECQTDNKKRLMMTVGDCMKSAGATNTAVAFMFDRRGKIIFDKQAHWDEEVILEQAIEAGAMDVQVGEDEAVVLTEVNDLTAVADAMAISLGAKPKSQDLVWLPKEDMLVTEVSQDAQAQLDKLFDKINDSGEDQAIQETYFNMA